MRFHRSRLNYINHIEPIGVTGELKLETDRNVEVFTPFHTESAMVCCENGICTVKLPEKCSYAILRLRK